MTVGACYLRLKFVIPWQLLVDCTGNNAVNKGHA